MGVGTTDERRWTLIRRFFASLFLSGQKVSVSSSVAGGKKIAEGAWNQAK
jgi:hypothetical protein